MGTTLPRFYTDHRQGSTLGDTFKLIMLAGHSVTQQPLYIMENLDGGLAEAVPFDEIGRSFQVDWERGMAEKRNDPET